MQPVLPSRVALAFFPFLVGLAQVGPNPLSVVVIDEYFRKKLLNFGEVLFIGLQLN